ncbi:DUF2452 domain-containing protein [Marinoscillum furvescens]|uniref:Uncharacterized protein DUF2452 n=1 Tax=Marinoscillum furvescens DSM 4134 TaxID=1122208 RepID=A0A3D9L739_MARFU|nr:DUF2452 domain-containing protein [Marinoscillum furvescens]REE02169.1 uncharacterized protein DUF2452 [Marinoscillum furvescens DSM 4134]
MSDKNKVDISKIDLEKEREKITDLPGLIEFAHNVGSALIKSEDKGVIKGQAMSAMYAQTDQQFGQIYEQMELLMKQANELRKRIDVSERIYSCQLNFKPVIGEIYHLYQRDDGSDFLSMIAPNEWGRSRKYNELVATVKLLPDHTWEVLNAPNDL